MVDSGASGHMTPTKEYFSEYHPFLTPEKVGSGDGRGRLGAHSIEHDVQDELKQESSNI